jgi:NADH-quinone oxidoreductase subunit L
MDHWLEPVFSGVTSAVHVHEGAEGLEIPLALSGVAAFVIGSALAYWMYITKKGEPAKRAAEALPGLYKLVYDKWRIDELYENTVIAAADALADTSAAWDRTIVDGIIAKIPALLVAASGSLLRAIQNGVVHVYAAMMVVGLFAFGWFFYMPHAAVTVDHGATEASGDFIVRAAPGLGYQYRWDADGNGQYDSEKFSDQAQVKVHLTEGQTQTVRLEIVNSFQRHGTAEVSLTRPVTPKPMQLGQN